MKQEIEAIRSYLKEATQNMLCEPAGVLAYPYIVPGDCCYSTTLWDWDSWLTDIGLRQVKANFPEILPQLEESEKGCIRNFAAFTEDDGYMPICIEKTKAYDLQVHEPGKPINMHKPCIVQHCAFVAGQTGDYGFVRPLLGKLEKFLNHYLTHFYHKKTGLFFFQDDCAVGVDNDPCIFFRPKCSTASIYLNSLMYKELRAMAELCGKCGEPDKAVGWNEQADRLRDAVNEQCYDNLNGFYYSVDINLLPNENIQGLHQGAPRTWDGLLMRYDVWSGVLAMWAGMSTPEQAARVRDRICDENLFWAPYGIRSLSKQEKMYNLKATNNPSNWLGPVWGVSNYMTFSALVRYGFDKEARELAEKTIRLMGENIIQHGSMFEYYNPETGEPIMTPNFINWNALVLNMIHWLEGREYISEF